MGATETKTCPNCGSELGSSIKVFGPGDEEIEVSAEGGILICQGCNMAVDPNAETEGSIPEQDENGVDQNDPEWNPRTEVQDEVRPEDEVEWDPSMGGSTSPPAEEEAPAGEEETMIIPPAEKEPSPE